MASRFPDPRYVRGDIVAIGDQLDVDTLRDAYRHGIFPWPHDALPLPWFSPRRRALLFFDNVHVGRTLRKEMGRARYEFSIDRDFPAVIRACAEAPRPGQDGTWIAAPIESAYTALHEAGDAHSVEVWENGALIGGLYGVDSGGAFTGESMFHRRTGASKIALLFLVEHLRARGVGWLDCQVMTPHMEALGARLVPRSKFLDLLGDAQAHAVKLF